MVEGFNFTEIAYILSIIDINEIMPEFEVPLISFVCGRPPIDFESCLGEYLKLLELPDDEEAHGYKKKVMRYCSTYRHTGVIGH